MLFSGTGSLSYKKKNKTKKTINIHMLQRNINVTAKQLISQVGLLLANNLLLMSAGSTTLTVSNVSTTFIIMVLVISPHNVYK